MGKLLRENGALPADKISPVGAVEFGGGVATLVTSPESILEDWRKVQPGEIIVYGALGSRDSAAAHGEALARARLDRLEATLAPISKLHPRAIDDLLSGVPSSIPATGVDGVILLMTFNRVAQTCHLVYRVSGVQMDIVRSMLSNGDLGSAIGQSGAQLVGEVNFNKDTDDVPDDSLQSAAGQWQIMGGGAPDSVVVTSSATDQTVPEDIAKEQSSIILLAFSPPETTTPTLEYIPIPEAFPPVVDCPAITFVAPQAQTTHTAVVISVVNDGPDHIPTTASPRATVSFKNNIPEGSALRDLIAKLHPAEFPINGVTLAVLNPTPDAGAVARMNAVVAALASSGRPTDKLRKMTGALSDSDRARLIDIGVKLDGLNEVIFLER